MYLSDGVKKMRIFVFLYDFLLVKIVVSSKILLLPSGTVGST